MKFICFLHFYNFFSICLGFDSLFILVTLHCASQIKVCCHYASKLADFDSEEAQAIAIDEFTKMHSKALKLIGIINSIFKFSNFGQLLSTLGLFVVVTFQARFDIDYCVLMVFVSSMCLLFMYCFLSEYISTMVTQFYLLF